LKKIQHFLDNYKPQLKYLPPEVILSGNVKIGRK
jgi:hypothetical protein